MPGPLPLMVLMRAVLVLAGVFLCCCIATGQERAEVAEDAVQGQQRPSHLEGAAGGKRKPVLKPRIAQIFGRASETDKSVNGSVRAFHTEQERHRVSRLQRRDQAAIVNATGHGLHASKRSKLPPQQSSHNARILNLIPLEIERWQAVVARARSQNYSIHGFYHTSNWMPHWQEVIEEQLYILDGRRLLQDYFRNTTNTQTESAPVSRYDKDGKLAWSSAPGASLLEESDGLYLNIAVHNRKEYDKVKGFIDKLKLKHVDKIRMNYNETVSRQTFRYASKEKKESLLNNTQLSEGEYTTIHAAQSYCRDMVSKGRKAMVYYFHNKGGCCTRKTKSFNPVASWRESMNTFNLEYPSICSRAILDNGYSACGFEYQIGHYSGNFWWADCEHLSALPTQHPRNRYDAWSVEYFIFRTSSHQSQQFKFGENCGYSTFKCEGVNHYDHECPPSWYQHKLTQYVKEDKLPPNHVATISRSPAWVKEVCGGMRSNGTSYKQRPGWQKLEASPLKPVGGKPLTPLPYRSLVGGSGGAKKEKKDRMMREKTPEKLGK
jgi:hypothetical protein